MAVTVNINGLSSVHQTSGGIATATLPDVCKTPPSATPVPYPNVAQSTDLIGGTATITVDGSSAAVQSSMFVRSTGDEAGSLGGVVSQVFAMEATFLSFSPTVLMEGQGACRLTDKMLMNKANTACMLGLLNPVILDMSKVPPTSIAPYDPLDVNFCQIQSFKLKCSHDDHPEVDGMDMNRDSSVLQVISEKDKPEVITVTTTGECGAGHPNYCPAVWAYRYPNGTWELLPAAEGKLTLPPPTQLNVSRQTAGQLIDRLTGDLPLSRDVWIVHPLICNFHPGSDVSVGVWGHVEVFNKALISGEVVLSYAHPTIRAQGPEAPDGTHTTPLHYNRMATWKIEGSFTANVFGREFKLLEKEADMGEADPLPFVGGLLDMIGSTTYIFDSMRQLGAGVKGEILWPKWKFSAGALELAEMKLSPRVGLSGTYGVSMDPVIGGGLTVSLFDYLILFGGPLAGPPGVVLAKALKYIKEKLAPNSMSDLEIGPDHSSRDDDRKAAGLAIDVDIELKVTGKVFGGFEMKFQEGKGELTDSTGIGGSLGVQVEARLLGKAKVWRVEFAGGGKAGAAAAEGEGKDPCELKATVAVTAPGGKLTCDGVATFSGLALYYLLYVEMAVVGAESDKKDDEDDAAPQRPLSNATAAAEEKEKKEEKQEPRKIGKKELKGSCVLIQPWTWSYKKWQAGKLANEAKQQAVEAGEAPVLSKG